MEKSKLGLDFNKVAHAKELAKVISDQVQDFVDGYSTVACERTLCRLMGVDGIDESGVPLPNVLVDYLKEKGMLSNGVLPVLGNAVMQTGKTPNEIAELVGKGELDLATLAQGDMEKAKEALQPFIDQSMERIKANRKRRENYIETIGEGQKPYLYIIVATGNIYEDVIQAQAGARQGADIIAVIRTTGQSLLDYVPYGATTEGFGVTFATQ